MLTEEDLFSFATLAYVDSSSAFAARSQESIAHARDHPSLEDEPGRDDLLFMTAIPWVSFTGFTHPTHLDPPDTIPRLAWGRFYEDDGRLKMPLNVRGHHALMDGLHVGRLYQRVQEALDSPENMLS